MHGKPVQDGLRDLFERHAAVKHRRHGARLLDILLQTVNVAVPCARHELHQITARLLDALVGIHQHAQGAGRWDLLALGKIASHVLSDLAVDQADHAAHRLLEADVLDHDQLAPADARPDIELAVRPQRQVDRRVCR